MISDVLEHINNPTGHSILRREQERQHNLRHLPRREFLLRLPIIECRIRVHVNHIPHPPVDEALHLPSGRDGLLALVSGGHEVLHGNLARLNCAVDLRTG